MNRLCLLVLIALSLWPAPAVAVNGPAQDTSSISAVPLDYNSSAAWATSGHEILSSWTAPDDQIADLPHTDFPASGIRATSPEIAGSWIFKPHAEKLPYHANAPPEL